MGGYFEASRLPASFAWCNTEKGRRDKIRYDTMAIGGEWMVMMEHHRVGNDYLSWLEEKKRGVCAGDYI